MWLRLQAVPEPSPSQDMHQHPIRPHGARDGDGMSPASPPLNPHPRERVPQHREGVCRALQALGTLPIGAPMPPPCSRLPCTATPDGCRMLGRRDFSDVN